MWCTNVLCLLDIQYVARFLAAAINHDTAWCNSASQLLARRAHCGGEEVSLAVEGWVERRVENRHVKVFVE